MALYCPMRNAGKMTIEKTHLRLEVNINCKNPLSRTNLVLDRGKLEITECSQTSARPPKDCHPTKGLPVCGRLHRTVRTVRRNKQRTRLFAVRWTLVCGGLHLSGSTNKNFRIDFCPLIIANNTYRSDYAEHDEIECF